MKGSNDNDSNKSTSSPGNIPQEENTASQKPSRMKDDGVSGRAEQEETANNYTHIEGHDEEDIEDMNSLKGIMKNRDEKKDEDS